MSELTTRQFLGGQRGQKADQHSTPSEMHAENATRLVHELRVHQIELELQNEELRSTQVQLQESLMEYSDLYDFAPRGYFTLNKGGLILKANLAGATLFGVERCNLIDKPLRTFVASESRAVFDDFRKTLFKTLTKQLCEVKQRKHSFGC